MNVDEITNEINKLSYEDRFKLYVRCFGFGNLLSAQNGDCPPPVPFAGQAPL